MCESGLVVHSGEILFCLKCKKKFCVGCKNHHLNLFKNDKIHNPEIFYTKNDFLKKINFLEGDGLQIIDKFQNNMNERNKCIEKIKTFSNILNNFKTKLVIIKQINHDILNKIDEINLETLFKKNNKFEINKLKDKEFNNLKNENLKKLNIKNYFKINNKIEQYSKIKILNNNNKINNEHFNFDFNQKNFNIFKLLKEDLIKNIINLEKINKNYSLNTNQKEKINNFKEKLSIDNFSNESKNNYNNNL